MEINYSIDPIHSIITLIDTLFLLTECHVLQGRAGVKASMLHAYRDPSPQGSRLAETIVCYEVNILQTVVPPFHAKYHHGKAVF